MPRIYFTFDIDRLHEKELESEMARHMNAAHMKNDIRKAQSLLKELREYDKKQGMPRGSYTRIEITWNGYYLTDGKNKLKIDILTKVG